LVCAGLMILAACQTMQTPTLETEDAPKSINKACLIFEQISYSRTDTEETRREIVGHNAAHNCYCNNVCLTEKDN